MNLQYISDHRGKVTGVFIPIQEWEALRKQLTVVEEPAPSPRDELAEALYEMKQIRAGKLPKPNLTDFLNEF